MELTQAYLKSQLHYNPVNGVFTRLTGASQWVGKEAGFINEILGYRVISVAKKQYYAHRLAHIYMTGEMPSQEIDHIDQKGDNNRWANLRQVTHQDNLKNQRLSRASTTGLCGVSFRKEIGKWSAYINTSPHRKYLGTHDTIFEAAAARISRQNKLMFSSRHGR